MSRTLPVILERTELAQADAQRAEDILRRALARADEPYPPNTQKAYTYAWAQWMRWCAMRGITELVPAKPDEVVGLLAMLAEEGKDHDTLALVLSAVSAVDAYERTSRSDGRAVQPVRSHLRVRRWMRANKVATAEKAGGEAPALLRPDLLAIVHGLMAPTSRRGLTLEALELGARRDRALLVVGWFAALRTSDLARLYMADVRVDAEGLELTLRKSKGDQTGQGEVLYLYAQSVPELCPRAAWLAWTQVLTEPYPERAFPRISTRGELGGAMSPEACGDVVTRRARDVGIRASGHSLRAGFATWAKLAGKAESDIQTQGRWKTTSVMHRYFRRGRARDQNPTKGLV